MLILDLELDDSTGDAPIWDFPQKLFPSTLRAAQDHGLVYDLVGRGLYNPTASHFIARYAKDKAIYTYDGMKHGGYSIQEKNAKLSTHLYGENVIIPSGYRTHVVIYHLRGGPDAQALFYRAQIATAHRLYNLNFSFETLDHLANITSTDQDFIRMNDEDRVWMRDPYSSRSAEYVLAEPPPAAAIPSLDCKAAPRAGDLSADPSKQPDPLRPSTPASLFPFYC